jgi:putative pyruvate formate lyase activating enzyme
MRLHTAGELAPKIEGALQALHDCTVCPRTCRVDRHAGEIGDCRIGLSAKIASFGPHFGEERPLVGPGRLPGDGPGAGSGTIFFSGCNHRCSFCQNFDISHDIVGMDVDARRLARIMLECQSQGCLNINLVTPSHVVPQILEALPIALDDGLRLPVVYNCGGYESVETLRRLDGVVDIYMPDFKFWYGEGNRYLSGINDYAEVATEALKEMHRQVGDLRTENGVAVQGLLVRHLVMPNRATNTAAIMEFIASISRDTYVNVMGQYRPCFQAWDDPSIARPLSAAEHRRAVRAAKDAGLHRIDGAA